MEDEGKHYITILMQAVVDNEQTVRNMEPHMCESWSWVPWSDLRSIENMFTPLLHVTHSDFTRLHQTLSLVVVFVIEQC